MGPFCPFRERAESVKLVLKMVRTGQAQIPRIDFANSSAPGLGIEILELADTIRRMGSGHFARPHRLVFFQVILVRSGTLAVELDFLRRRLLKPGSILVVRPGQVQALVAGSGCEGRMLLFESSFAASHIPVGAIRKIPSVMETPPGDVLDAFRELEREFAKLRAVDSVTRSILLHQLLVLCWRLRRCGGVGEADLASPVFERFEDLLELWFARERSVGFYAGELGLSEKTLGRVCIAQQGQTPKRIIEQRIILEAKRVLAHGETPVKAVAEDLGFSEVTNFVKYFRRSEGVTPSAFRRRFR
jgi:AraC-like DNA-binding protein